MCMVIYYLKSLWVCLCCLSLLFQTQIAVFPYGPDYFSLLSGHCSWKSICGSFLRSTMDRVSYRGFIFVFTESHRVLPIWEPYKTKFITWSWFRPRMIKVKICFTTGMEPRLLRDGSFYPLAPFFTFPFEQASSAWCQGSLLYSSLRLLGTGAGFVLVGPYAANVAFWDLILMHCGSPIKLLPWADPDR